MSDVLGNILLYAPLGVAMALCGWSRPRVLIGPLLLSASIEFAQTWIPGRDASLGDVVANSLGAAAGFAVVRTSVHWLRPRGGLRVALAIAAALGALSVLATTGILFQMDLPRSTYWGQWTPDLGYLQWYRGRVLQASLGPSDLPGGGPLANSAEVRALLLARAPLSIRAVAGPRVPALGSLFSIYDDRTREIVLVGPDRDDLVLRYRTRAVVARLDHPDLRVEDALRGIAPGDRLDVVVRQGGKGYCVDVNGRSSCGVGLTVGRGWALLSYPEALPTWLRILLDDAWVGCLLIPAGFWLTGRHGALVVFVLAAGLVVVPALTGLIPTPPGEFVGAGAGVGLGVLIRRRVVAGGRKD